MLPPQVELALVSRAHVGEVLSFQGPRAPQIVVRISGTKLLPALPSEDLIGLEIDGDVVSDALLMSDHGFFGFEPARHDGWQSAIIGVDGDELVRCLIGDKTARCEED